MNSWHNKESARRPAPPFAMSDLSRLDLNLLPVFGAIFRERNLTRVAQQLSLSQSAVSHALARMREQLGDPLFVRTAQGMAPTPLAARMWPDIEEGLAQLGRAMARSRSFDPARDVRRVVIAMHDEIEPILLPALLQELQRGGPLAEMACVRLDRPMLQTDLLTGRIDLAIDVAQVVDDTVRHAALFESPWVVVSASPAAISAEAYCAASHITVSSRRSGLSVEDSELARRGLNRSITVRCQQYETAFALVARGQQLLTLPENLSRGLAASTGVFIHPMPIPLPPVQLHLFWHLSRDSDPANQWLRALIGAANSRALQAGGRARA